MVDRERKDKYAMGVASIDDEHKELFDVVHEVESAVARNAAIEETGGLLKKLAVLTTRHFTDEEAVMREAKYPGIGLHEANHQRLIEKITAFVVRHIQGGSSMNEHALNFLRDWLTFHVENDDARLSDWLKDRAREQERAPKNVQAVQKSA